MNQTKHTPHRLLIVALCAALAQTTLAQAPRPPIQKLSGLTGDVSITSPSTGQVLRFNSVTGKWENGVALTDTVITSTADAGPVADFAIAQLLSPSAGALLDWSAGLKFLAPIQVDNGFGVSKTSIDPTARKLYGSDGTTPIIDWNATSTLKFPQLTNSSGKVFLTTDVSGNVSLANVPDAGTIPQLADQLLAGDGAGNAVVTSFARFANGWLLEPATGSGSVDLAARALDGGDDAIISAGNDEGQYGAALRSLGTSSLSAQGIVQGGDAIVYNTNASRRVVIAAQGGVLFTNSSQGGGWTPQRVFIGNGLVIGPTGTTDPGAGVVNVSNSYRIANAGPWNHSLLGNGTSYVDGSVPGKVSVTSTVDQTATTETAHVVFTVPANSAAAGTTYRIAAWGNMDNGSTGTPPTFTPRIRWGGTGGVQLIATPAIVGPTSSAGTNKSWKIEAYVTLRSIGSLGTAFCALGVEHHLGAAYAYSSDEADSGASAISVDTTANKDLDLTWALSSTSGTPHVRTIGATIEIVRP